MWDSASSNGRLVEFLTACVLKATGKSTQFKKMRTSIWVSMSRPQIKGRKER